MIVAVTGSSGLVGSALLPELAARGHQALRVVRPQSSAGGADTIRWDPAAGALDAAVLGGVEAVVHLAGASVAAGRWTLERKRRILESRTLPTRLLAETCARLPRPPRVLVSASATGYYGDRGDETLTEASAPGSGFLAEVCRAWEAATEPAAARGVRVVSLRIGIALSSRGGALAKMLPPFRLGLGGPIGSGRQWTSWIALDDLIGAILHSLTTESLRGPVNAVAPHPVTNREFSRALGRVLRRPALLPLPAFAARLLLGEMADELLLASARVLPARLVASGYAFEYPELPAALRAALGRAG
ncbi:MAG: TIGR01777 family protein [Candidatus Rokubacteria bacterium]|nr:TIGR01777 family protein [Candidatus Rokubacteria bacterium]